MKQYVLVIIFLFFLFNQAISNIEIEIVSNEPLIDNRGIDEQEEISKMINLSQSILDSSKPRVRGSLGDILSFGQNKIKKQKQNQVFEQIEDQLLGPIFGGLLTNSKPVIEIEIMSRKPKNLNVSHRPLPGRAFSKIDNAMQLFFETFTDSILGPHYKKISHKKVQSATHHRNNPLNKIDKEIGHLIDELSESVNHNEQKVVPIKLIELKHKKVPLIFNGNQENNLEAPLQAASEIPQTLNEVTKEETKAQNPSSPDDIIAKLEKSTWFKDMNTNKFVALLLKYITYSIFAIILFFLFYSCLMISLPSQSMSSKTKQNKDEEEERESINKRQSEVSTY